MMPVETQNGTWFAGGNPQRYGIASNTVLFPMTSISFGATGQTMTGRFKLPDYAYALQSGFSFWDVFGHPAE